MGLKDKCRMTWEPAKSRWRKMHKGKVYTVSCDALGTPTKEVSYQAANAWWASRLADLTPRHPHAAYLARLDRMLAWAERHEPENVDALRAHREDVRAGGVGDVTL